MAKPPKLDKRTASEIYQQALDLAQKYCPQWAENWESGRIDPHDTGAIGNDPGLVILKLFSQMTEHLVHQLNRVPEKYRLAFFDFMGVELTPARAAKVPLYFTLAEGSKQSLIPRGTPVAHSEKDLLFETLEDLTASEIQIEKLVSVEPAKLKFTDHSTAITKAEGITAFRGKEYLPLELRFFSPWFAVQNPSTIVFNFEFEKKLSQKKFKELFGKWHMEKISKLKPVFDHTSPESQSNSHSVTLELDLPVLDSLPENNLGSWITVGPQDIENSKNLLSDLRDLPKCKGVHFDLKAGEILPEHLFYNDSPLESNKTFHPFGPEPKEGDAFYIGSTEVFSKVGALVEINVNISFFDKDIPTPTLVWEYWNGKRWKNLHGWLEKLYVDCSWRFGKIFFLCPEIALSDLGGQESRWIRCRIEEGDFGHQREIEVVPHKEWKVALQGVKGDKGVKENLISYLKNNGWYPGVTQKESTLNPPQMDNLTLSYEFEEETPEKLQIYKDFKYEALKEEKPPFQPYGNFEETGTPALYLGLAPKDALNKNKGSLPLSLYFDIGNSPHEARGGMEKSKSQREAPKAGSWQYFNGSNWKELDVIDNTRFFSQSELVQFILPPDIQPHKEFEESLYWIRVSPAKGEWEKLKAPQIHGIYPNSVWAKNSQTIEDETLGSGNGQPGQVLPFSQSPVLRGQRLEVKEPSLPTESEIQQLKRGQDSLRIIRNEIDEIEEIWVEWQEVSSFALSTSTSRHYVVDRLRTRITFGDGVRGMIPPQGKGNILARQYEKGGGKEGNVEAYELTDLKTTVPHVEEVANPVPAEGGRDQGNLEEVIKLAPHNLKHRNRAVTKEDFIHLTKEVSPRVASVMGKMDPKDNLVIRILTKESGAAPRASVQFLNFVEDYLKKRCFVALEDKIQVKNPDYQKIDAQVQVVLKKEYFNQSSQIKRKIEDKITSFFHPLQGGQKGQGWNFGQNIFASELSAVLGQVREVKYIVEIKFKLSPSQTYSKGINTRIFIESDQLPLAGNVECQIKKSRERANQ